MSGTTDTWVIVVAAFGGGLVGAILQPLMSYALDRVRATETIRKNRERSLRRMIFAKIRETRRVQAWAGGIIFGRNPVVNPAPIGGPFWEPHRIKDVELFKNVEAYDDRAARLHTAGYEKDVDEIDLLDRELNALQVKITLAMDDLNWPEADQEDA